MEFSKNLFFCLLITVTIHYSSACNGYKARLVKVENCGGDNQVIKLEPGATVELNKNCEIVIKGCAETLGFSTAKVKYTILKNGNRITSGNADLCEEMKKDTKGVSAYLGYFGIPTKCPVNAMKKCSDGSQTINISKYKTMLPLAMGNIDITIEGEHDTGKTCIHIVVNISR